MTTRNFDIDLKTGKNTEKELANILRCKLSNLTYIDEVDWKKYGFDLRATFENDKGQHYDKNIEVKGLAGQKVVQWGKTTITEHLDTGVVEVWADDQKRKRPHWFRDDVDIIVFKNKVRGKFYFYQAQPVIEYLKNWNGKLTWAKNDCEDTSGWIMQFYWSPDERDNMHPNFVDENKFLPGFMFELQGKIEDELPQ